MGSTVKVLVHGSTPLLSLCGSVVDRVKNRTTAGWARLIGPSALQRSDDETERRRDNALIQAMSKERASGSCLFSAEEGFVVVRGQQGPVSSRGFSRYSFSAAWNRDTSSRALLVKLLGADLWSP